MFLSDNEGFTADVSSDLCIDEEYVSVEYVNHDIVVDSYSPTFVEISAEEIVFKLSVNVALEITASFEVSMKDPIDRDYIRLGTTSRVLDDEYETELLVYLKGNFSEELSLLEVDDVEVIEYVDHFDFGQISFDFDHV